jgi:hypothetical protein
MSTTPEFRRQRAKVAANTRHHPGRADDDRVVLAAAARERKLRGVLGDPPEGMATWLDYYQDAVKDAPPLTDEQRDALRLLLGSGHRATETEPASDR